MPVKRFVSFLWEKSLSWDEVLPLDLFQQFQGLVTELQAIAESFRVPRWYHLLSDRIVHTHLFADASFAAMGCVVYFVQDGTSWLVISKFKVIPHSKKRVWTIPKLELTAMLLGSRLLANVLDCFKTDYSFSVHTWTDSEICLHWLTTKKLSNLKPFVANRVSKINSLIPSVSWSHVNSADNAADIISRGSTAQQLLDSNLWEFGPSWLTPELWPCSKFRETDSCICVAAEPELLFQKVSLPELAQLINVSRFSSYSKLINVIVWVRRFVKRCRKQPCASQLSPTPEEITSSEKLLIHILQHDVFPVEYNFLLHSKQDSPLPPLVQSLSLFMDNEHIIRAAGRLQKSSLEMSAWCPILIPKRHHVTTLIIRHFHNLVFHAGVLSTVARLRQTFWILAARSQVQNILRKCVTCRRLTSRALQLPAPPDLPSFRVNDWKPFSSVGVDFSGSFIVKSSRGHFSKCYICIFSCCTTRAINLELLPDMSTQSFVLALRSHCADYTTPNTDCL